MDSYTLHELLYEYHDKIERTAAVEEHFELNADKIEEDAEKETLAWIEEEERIAKEEAEKAAEEVAAKEEAWMIEQLKKEHGDGFGEDIDSNFE